MSRPIPRMPCALPAAMLLIAYLLSPAWVHATPPTEERLASVAEAIASGQYQSAIAQSEALADSDIVHPDISFNRGLAYLQRASSPQAQNGDYGQAAAGFREALLLRPDDPEAKRALQDARVAVARRAGDRGGDPAETIGLGTRLLLSINLFAVAAVAALASGLLSTALLLRLAPRFRRSLGFGITASIGALLLIPATVLYFFAAGAQADWQRAIVVSKQAPVVGPGGQSLKGTAPLPEASEIVVGDTRGRLVRVVGGGGDLGHSDERWLRRSQLRLLRDSARP